MTVDPYYIMVAPNGARRTQSDHQAVPVTVEETALCARRCMEEGAALIHLHVRDRDQKHVLDSSLYEQAVAAVRRECGDGIVVQITTEAVGIYKADQQMDVVREVRPEAVSLAVREILPDAASEAEGAAFLDWVRKERIAPQYILYSAEDLGRFCELRDRGVIPGDRHSVLFVLGKYVGVNADPADLDPFLKMNLDGLDWAVCAFGPQEQACVLASYEAGGSARIGFENNVHLKDGALAPDNEALVQELYAAVKEGARSVGTADSLRALMEKHLS